MTDQLLSIPYINDILHQPQALQDTLAALAVADLEPLSRLGTQLRSGRWQRVILTGMGSSYHVLHPLLLGLIGQGLPAQMVETSELIHHQTGLFSPDALIVAVSQSGASVEILELLRSLPPQAGLIGVTNTPGSPLAGRAEALLLTSAGVENMVSCKTYVAALVALVALEALLAGRDTFKALAELESLPEAVAGYLADLPVTLQSLEQRLQGVQYLVLAGRGSSLAAAGTGGLIIKEAAHFPVEGMSCAAFRHGPLNMVSKKNFVMVYEGLEPTRAINRNLVRDIQAAGGNAALVESDPVRNVFHLPVVPDLSAGGLAILEILPAQLLSVALARLTEHVPGLFTWGSKVTSIE